MMEMANGNYAIGMMHMLDGQRHKQHGNMEINQGNQDMSKGMV